MFLYLFSIDIETKKNVILFGLMPVMAQFPMEQSVKLSNFVLEKLFSTFFHWKWF